MIKKLILIILLLQLHTPAHAAGVDAIIIIPLYLIFTLSTLIAVFSEIQRFKSSAILSIAITLCLIINLLYSATYTIYIMELTWSPLIYVPLVLCLLSPFAIIIGIHNIGKLIIQK